MPLDDAHLAHARSKTRGAVPLEVAHGIAHRQRVLRGEAVEAILLLALARQRPVIATAVVRRRLFAIVAFFGGTGAAGAGRPGCDRFRQNCGTNGCFICDGVGGLFQGGGADLSLFR